jgi:phosphoribosylglycinamide formyltransferase 2
MNRERIRVLAAEELKLPTSPYAFASSLEELQAACARIGFPCFVKPVMSSSGKGQSRLKSAEDVAPAWEKALSAGRVREARVIVEGEIEFDFEITQLTVRAADGTHFCEPADEPCGARQEPRYGGQGDRRAGRIGHFRCGIVCEGR